MKGRIRGDDLDCAQHPSPDSYFQQGPSISLPLRCEGTGSAWHWLTKYSVQPQTQGEDEVIFIVIVIMIPLIKVSFIHVNILPLSPLSLF